MGAKNQRAVYEWVNISDNLVYEWVRFFKGQVYDWGRFRNIGLNPSLGVKTAKMGVGENPATFTYIYMEKYENYF